MKLTKVKSLIPAPKDGEGGITYEIVTNLSVLNADYDGHVQAHYLQPIAYATQDGVREMIHCSANGDWQIEYSIDGGVYTGCYSFNVRFGGRMRTVYGISWSEVVTIQESVRFQLVYDGDVMFQMAPIQVVRNGKRGPFYFPAGVFEPNTEYTRNDNSAPYVSVVDDTVTPNVTYYYMLIADTNLVEGVYIAPGDPDASDIWELMTSNFKYLITEAIFSAFAKLGGFIVQGNNFISQYGALLYNNSGTVTKTAIDSTNYNTLVGGRLPYTYFDGTVTDPSSGNYKFVPSLMLDALTGKGSFGGDSVRFNADGSGWLANKNVEWDAKGNLRIAGLTYKKKTIITPGNLSEYMSVVGTDYDNDGNVVDVYMLDIMKAGNWIVLDGIQPGICIKLPSFRFDGTYTEDDKNLARSLVGCSLIIDSINHTYLCGFKKTHMRFYDEIDVTPGNRLYYEDNAPDAGNMFFSNQSTVYLECVLNDTKDSNGWYKEDIMWKARVVRK